MSRDERQGEERMKEQEESATAGPNPEVGSTEVLKTESPSTAAKALLEGFPRRSRRSRKRTRFGVPQHPAKSVKALWQEASPKDREEAHRLGMAILETWLGKRSRLDVAQELKMPVLRVWQLSQQAVSGMLAGLLIQPRTRRTASMPALPPDEDPKVLLKRIASLERELQTANRLNEVLKLLPDRPPAPPEKVTKKATPKKPARRAKPAGEKRRRTKAEGGAAAGGAASSRTEA